MRDCGYQEYNAIVKQLGFEKCWYTWGQMAIAQLWLARKDEQAKKNTDQEKISDLTQRIELSSDRLREKLRLDPDGSREKARIDRVMAQYKYLKTVPQNQAEKERDDKAWVDKLHSHWDEMGIKFVKSTKELSEGTNAT